MAFGRLDQMETRKTVKMQVKVPNGRATPCGTAVTDTARRLINNYEHGLWKKHPQRDLAMRHARWVLDMARGGDWKEALKQLETAIILLHQPPGDPLKDEWKGNW